MDNRWGKMPCRRGGKAGLLLWALWLAFAPMAMPMAFADDSGRVIENGINFTIMNNPGTISETGVSSGVYRVFGNKDSIIILNNSGVMSAWVMRGAVCVDQGTTVDTLTNSGEISGFRTGLSIQNATRLSAGGIVNTLNNSGTISGGTAAIHIGGGYLGPPVSFTGAALGALINSGTISGSTAILVDSNQDFSQPNDPYHDNLGTVTNTGRIEGDITSDRTDLNFAGGSGGAEGVLTGYPYPGFFRSFFSSKLDREKVGKIKGEGVNFLSGAFLLNDDVISSPGTTNAATLRIERNISITGPYVQTGTLVIEVAPDGTYGKLKITGAATLDGSTVRVSGSGTATNASYTVLTAGTTLSANGLSLAAGDHYGNTHRIDGTNLIVTLGQKTPWAVKGVEAGSTTAELGTALDSLGSDSRLTDIFSSLLDLSDAGQSRALRQMVPDQVTTQLNVDGATVVPATAAIQNRQSARMDGGDGSSGVSTGSAPADRAVWGRFLGGHADRDGASGYSARTSGVLFGADGYLGDDVLVGGAASWLRAVSRGNGDAGGSRTTLDSFQLSGYGTWRPDGGPAYVRGLAGVGRNLYDQQRRIEHLNASATANYAGWQLQGKLGGGYDLRLGVAMVTPLASLQVVRVETDGYSESGAGGGNLSVDANGVNSVQSELGAQVSGGLGTTEWGLLKGNALLAWVHDYAHAPIAVSATMGGVGFVSKTERSASNGARLDLGTTLERDDSVSVSLEYQGELRSDYQSHTGMLTLRSAF